MNIFAGRGWWATTWFFGVGYRPALWVYGEIDCQDEYWRCCCAGLWMGRMFCYLVHSYIISLWSLIFIIWWSWNIIFLLVFFGLLFALKLWCIGSGLLWTRSWKGLWLKQLRTRYAMLVLKRVNYMELVLSVGGALHLQIFNRQKISFKYGLQKLQHCIPYKKINIDYSEVLF